ncbi:MAG: hypothetical protein V3S25_00650 [Nitrospirales bacterium]
MEDQDRLDRIDELEAARVNLIAGLEEDGSVSPPPPGDDVDEAQRE